MLLQKVKNYSLVDWFLPNYEALFVFIAWGGFLLACTYFIAHREQQVRLGVALLQTKQAQLQTLRYQLNPHFLFNVLNSVDVSVLSEDKDTAHQMLKHLSRFLRNSLQQGEQDKIKLEQEFEVLSDFVSIEQLRFGDALQLDMELSDVCRAAMLPPMLLQPLVENAIKFAWSQTEKGQVQVTARKQDQQLVIEINNSKVGLSEKRSGTGTGLGLYSAWRIIEAMGGRIEFTTQSGQGSCFSLHLPLDNPSDPPQSPGEKEVNH